MSPEAIDAMLAAGCTAEQIAAAVKADMRRAAQAEEDRKAARREGNRKRQQAWRDRNADNAHNAVMQRDTPPKRKVSPCTPSKENNPPEPSEPNGSSYQSGASAKPSARIELVKVLDAEHADQLIEHRKRIGAPLTASAAGKLATKLAKWPDPNEAVDEMLANGWQGFEPRWLESRRGGLRVVAGQQAPPDARAEMQAAILKRMQQG